MLEVTVTTFRKHIPDYLGKVRKGEDISLTSRGKVIARLVPPVDERQSAREQLAALRSSTYFIDDIISPIDVEWAFTVLAVNLSPGADPDYKNQKLAVFNADNNTIISHPVLPELSQA